MRRAAKVDKNQAEIVRALRQAGASVQCLHTVGQGCPDLLVATRDGMWLMEIKDGKKSPSKRLLTEDEFVWHCNWKSPVYIVYDAEEALKVLRMTGS